MESLPEAGHAYLCLALRALIRGIIFSNKFSLKAKLGSRVYESIAAKKKDVEMKKYLNQASKWYAEFTA